MRLLLLAVAVWGIVPVLAVAAEPQKPGAWAHERTRAILDKTQKLRLAPDLSGLTAGERTAVDRLLEVGAIFQDVHEHQRHHQARAARAALQERHKRAAGPQTEGLLDLYRLSQGPILTTLENAREAFLPVDAEEPGKNVYPTGVSKAELEAWLQAHPDDRARFLDLRSVVRRATADNVQRDQARLTRHPVLDTLHPGLKQRIKVTSGGFYAVPYSVEYADEMVKAHGLLHQAADAVERDDAELARYLRNRGRDLLSDDYESGDAAWITGRFGKLNAQIGAYEVYDDNLLGVKAFYSLSLLLRDQKASEQLRAAIKGLQQIEDALPYAAHKKVREDIPVGVYDVIADFGQARGFNTATILPNEAYLARRYGRTILLRANVMQHPDIFKGSGRTWQAAVTPAFADDLKIEGDFHRTLWHEVGHYLGVDADEKGRSLDEALEENSSTFEEMKADLVSLFSMPMLRAAGHYDDARVRAVYAAGVRRTLQNNRPRREQAYQTMQLMQFNYFLENGLLSFDPAAQALVIHYEKYPQVVAGLLRLVLEVQRQGDKAASDAFVERWTKWDPALHDVIAKKMRDQQQYRFRIPLYAVLGE